MDKQQQVEEELFKLTGEQASADAGANAAPIFKVIGDDKIPVSKEAGKLWKHRKGTAMRRMDTFQEVWNEALRYYNHDHVGDANQPTSKGSTKRGDETENLVFSNVSTLMPILYAQNPRVEFTSEAKGQEEDKEDSFASTIEHVINLIFSRKIAPGVHLKSKIRKATLYALLCNCAWIKLNWTLKADSSEGALVELERIAKEYSEAKDQEKLKDLEGQLQALDDVFSLATAAGPSLSVKHPGLILVDEDAEDPGLSDCKWLMEADYIPTAYLNARYTEKKDKEDRLIYKPSHVVKSNADGNSDTMFESNYDQLKPGTSFKDYGFRTEEEFEVAQYTKVWYVWDKLMKRMYMYQDNDWTFPVWVWNNPLPISRFFPYFCLTFHEGTDNIFAKGETTYYLDQQDAINEINRQQANTRRKLRTRLIYDVNAIKAGDVDKVVNSDEGGAIGIAVPEGGKLDDAFHEITPPEIRFKEVFDKADKYNAINRLAAISEMQRGEQLRTNTTQDAVNALQDASNTRIAEKQGKLEELVEDIAHAMSELAVQYLTTDDIESLCGSQRAAHWPPNGMSTAEFNRQYSLTVIAGSTEKPTSKAKQEQALKLGQVMGQFARTTPGITMLIIKVMQKAFSEMDITEEDWMMIKQSMMQQAQPQGAPSEGEDAGAAEAEQLKAQQKKEKNPSLGDIDIKKLFAQVLKVVPPEMKQGIEEAVKSGISPTDALEKLIGGMTQEPSQTVQ